MDEKTLKFAKTLNPNFVRAWECNGCENCNSFWSIFGQTKFDENKPVNGMLSGGFACPHCGFGNAGQIHVDLLEEYEVEA